MSIFGDIVGKLFGKAKPDQPPPTTDPAPDPPNVAQAAAPLADEDVAAVNSNLLLAMDAPFKKNGASRLGKFEVHLRPGAAGVFTLIPDWRLYADHQVAPLRRSRIGSIAGDPYMLNFPNDEDDGACQG